MPLNAKGRKILREMKEQYGEERGEEVFYASVNTGKIEDVEGPASDSAGHRRRIRGSRL
jgi:hypothetical protein